VEWVEILQTSTCN